MGLFDQREDELFERSAELIADKAIEKAGNIGKFIVIPMATVCLMTGLTRMTVPQKMPVVRSGGKNGVRLSEIEAYLAKHEQPVQERKKGKGGRAA